jgi:hypothetical protein
MIATLKPSCDALIAAGYPPGPLPNTRMSYAMMKILMIELQN